MSAITEATLHALLTASDDHVEEETKSRDSFYQDAALFISAIGAISVYQVRKNPVLTGSIFAGSLFLSLIAEELSVVAAAKEETDRNSLLRHTWVLKRLPTGLLNKFL